MIVLWIELLIEGILEWLSIILITLIRFAIPIAVAVWVFIAVKRMRSNQEVAKTLGNRETINPSKIR
jgi:hypothetical protein